MTNTNTHTEASLATYIGRTVRIQTWQRGLVSARVLEVVPGFGTATPPYSLAVRFETGEEGSGWLPDDFK